ncbi:MAG: monovalent cation/H(+) antiporter subunit G [Myxococcota bacterium]
MSEWIGSLLLLTGAAFSLIASIGLVRLPDLYVRMHAATKAGTLGAGLILAAAAAVSHQLDVITRVTAGIVFLVVTAPIAAHLLGRAGYVTGVPLWSETCLDELDGQYDEAGKLKGVPRPRSR